MKATMQISTTSSSGIFDLEPGASAPLAPMAIGWAVGVASLPIIGVSCTN